ncbi:MAG: hypothetical protein HZA63_05185 [Rhodocyclales bacterium]|nr:hypothetical protein [Rhodocyclales bacterium]
MCKLMCRVLVIAAAMWCSLICSQAGAQMPGRFGFQGILLNTHFSKAPAEATDACVGPRNGQMFCAFLSKITEEECLVHLTYIDELLSEITVYFPESIYLRVAAAMQSKYWSPDVRVPGGGYEWWAKEKNSMEMPTEKIHLFPKLAEPMRIDKYFFKKERTYSWMVFEHSGPLLGQLKRDTDRIKKDL